MLYLRALYTKPNFKAKVAIHIWSLVDKRWRIQLNRLTKHVNELFKDVPESEQKATMIQEVLQNLEEKVWDLMEQGKAEEDAINKAIVEFGDAEG
jgi:hypothetical protein